MILSLPDPSTPGMLPPSMSVNGTASHPTLLPPPSSSTHTTPLLPHTCRIFSHHSLRICAYALHSINTCFIVSTQPISHTPHTPLIFFSVPSSFHTPDPPYRASSSPTPAEPLRNLLIITIPLPLSPKYFSKPHSLFRRANTSS